MADPKNPITATWAGIYFVNSDAVDSSAYTFYIRPDNEIIAAAGGRNTYVTYSTGKWELNGKTYTTTLNTLYGESPEGQAVTGTYDSTAGTLIGTWNDVSGANTSSGTLRLVGCLNDWNAELPSGAPQLTNGTAPPAVAVRCYPPPRRCRRPYRDRCSR